MLNGANQNRLRHIQGLRGLAVALVVIYHGGFSFNGGFIGVDVFFVISGFVIGNSLSREIEKNGSVNWANFYVRRAKRLLPALALTLVGTILLQSVFFGFESVGVLSKALTSGSLFVSNFYFFLEQGYVALDTNPLRNLWSLSVEEQFYFVLPLLFLFAKFRSATAEIFRRKLVILSSIALAVSFLGSLILVNHSLQFAIPQFLLPRRFGFFHLSLARGNF